MILSLLYRTWLLSALLCLFSCSDHHSGEFIGGSLVDTMTKDELASPSRHLASAPQTPIVSFVVIYEGDLTTMLTHEHSAFRYLIDAYDLQLDAPSAIDQIDEVYQKVTLYAHTPLDAPLEVGKKLSLVDEVLMVQVGEADADEGLIE